MPTSQEPSIPGAAPAQAAASTNEAELLSRVARGDLEAFERLYRSYLPRLTRFLQQVMRRTSVVDEAINDTMLVVWRKAATYSGDSKVSTWIFAIAYRRGLKLLKRFDEPVSDEVDLSSPGEDATENGVMQLELRAVLGAAMA